MKGETEHAQMRTAREEATAIKNRKQTPLHQFLGEPFLGFDTPLIEEEGRVGLLKPTQPNPNSVNKAMGHFCELSKISLLIQLSACNCSNVGAVDNKCNNMTGSCFCHPYVTGKLCDRCEQNAFNYTSSGCSPCNCDIDGSNETQCDLVSYG